MRRSSSRPLAGILHHSVPASTEEVGHLIDVLEERPSNVEFPLADCLENAPESVRFHTNMKPISRVAIISGPDVSAWANGFSSSLKNASRCWFTHM